MSSPDDYDVGYGKTPKQTRWKKGQCGNPRKRWPLKIPSEAEMIEAEFARIVSIKEHGASRQVTVYEVILIRLLPEIARGNRRAIRIRKKYQAYAQAHPTVVYEPAQDAEVSAAEYRKSLDGPYRCMTKEEAEVHKAWSELNAIELAEIYRDQIQKA